MSNETISGLSKLLNELTAEREALDESYLEALYGAIVALKAYGATQEPSGWENICLAVCCRALQQAVANELKVPLLYGSKPMPFGPRYQVRRPSVLEIAVMGAAYDL